ncbi:MAG: sulfurtransferase-like selenium metabolism protein YedF [Treponema sp.]|nr:sulfurtransferase-like selenium metabolism protein YedF [Treponema sp.]
MDRNESVILISSDRIGSGSDELGKILIKSFIYSLTELPVPPKTIIFMNSGVKLVTEGSNTIEDLEILSGKGTSILACGTCVNYYSIKLGVGEITNMVSIAGFLNSAERVITL